MCSKLHLPFKDDEQEGSAGVPSFYPEPDGRLTFFKTCPAERFLYTHLPRPSTGPQHQQLIL